MSTFLVKTYVALTAFVLGVVTFMTVSPQPAYARSRRRGAGLIEFMILAGFAVVIFVVFRTPITNFVRRIVDSLTSQF